MTGIQVGHWIHHAADLESARFLARQCSQELAHVRLMRAIFDRLGIEPRPAHRLVRFLATGLMGSGWEEYVCLEMALGEGYVLGVSSAGPWPRGPRGPLRRRSRRRLTDTYVRDPSIAAPTHST